MNYTIQQIHIFLKVILALGMTIASGELFMNQPVVSIQLLENELVAYYVE